MALFAKKDLSKVRGLAALPWTNPFSLERADLSERLLESEVSDLPSDRDWEALMPTVMTLLQGARAKFVKPRGSLGRDALDYQSIVFLYVYYRLADDFDKVIYGAHERGSAQQRITFYDAFLKEIEHWLPFGFVGEYQDFEYERLFAVFFQVRRAYYHINYYIIGSSAKARELRERVWQSVFTHNMDRYQRVLAERMGDIITLITGPSGTGKELVARGIGLSRYIPFNTDRREFVEDFVKAFFPINISALSSNLVESELFGHRKGAFTGALQNRLGYLETCGPFGTVFLDEIGEVDPAIQVKLLRVLQTRTFNAIGETDPRLFRGKIMAATNRDLVEEIEAGRFREDFYFRLNADRVYTPGLRDILNNSPEELEGLVAYIASKVVGAEEAGSLTDEVCTWITQRLDRAYSWPGNFRELEQCVRNVLVHGEYLPQEISRGEQQQHAFVEAALKGQLTANEFLSVYTTRLYQKTPNYEAVARHLELDRRTVKKYVEQAQALDGSLLED